MDTELIVQLRRELHNNPEKSNHETKTKQILMRFIKEHTQSIEIEDRGTWFYALKRGTSSLAPLAFRADFDAVTCADGIPRHLCGHDGHSAVLAGFALWLETVQLTRDVYLIFQPGEENGTGAAVCASLINEKHIGEIYGFHNIPGYDCGEVILPEHTFACASTGLEICFHGRQAHAAYPQSGANPGSAIAGVIIRMDELIREKHRGIVLGTVIGIESGSRSYGVSAGEGTLRLTLRAEHQDEYDTFIAQIEETAAELSKKDGLTIDITRIEEFPATINDAKCVAKLDGIARSLGRKVTCPSEPFRWSEDFGYYLQRTRGAFMGIGCGRDHAALHTDGYEFEDAVIEPVLALYREIVKREAL